MYAWIKRLSGSSLDCAPMRDGLLIGDIVGYKLVNRKDAIGQIRFTNDDPDEHLCEIVTVYRKETL